MVRVARLVCIFFPEGRKQRCCRRQAVGKRLSTGHSHLIVRVSLHTNRKAQTPRKADSGLLVRVARLELAASWSQTRRPTNWATPGNIDSVLSGIAPYSRFAAPSGCKQKHASATPTKQLGHTRICTLSVHAMLALYSKRHQIASVTLMPIYLDFDCT